jgi:hypothetical protein
MNRIILALMALNGIEKDEMAAALCMSLDTFYRRLRKPDTFTLGELKKAAKKCRVTLERLIGGQI